MKSNLLVLVLAVLSGTISLPLTGTTPPFSYMTLNGTTQIAVAVDEVDRDFKVYGLDAAQVETQVTTQLAAAGVQVVPYATAVSEPGVGLLRVRVLTNHDANGFYHLSVKLELRQKIPLGNAAGGFVSEAVWTDANNGVMLASEIDKITNLVAELTGNFITEYRAQNGKTRP